MGEDTKFTLLALLILILATSGIQWLLVRSMHWSVALVVSGVISFVISFLYVSLSHATPNGAGNSVNVSAYITPTLLIYFALLCSFCLVCYFSKTQVSKMAYVTSIGLIAFMLIGRMLFSFIVHTKNISSYKEFTCSSQIEVINETGSAPIISIIFFTNDSSLYATDIELKTNGDENAILKQSSLGDFPRFANTIGFLCISSNTDNLFFQEFPFDYSLCQEKEDAQLGGKVILPMKLVLKVDRKVDLYIDNQFVKQYQFDDQE